MITNERKASMIHNHLKKIMVSGGIATLAALFFLSGTLSYQYLAKRMIDSEWSILKLELNNKSDVLIDYHLHELKHKTNADRVWVFRFHNGGHLVGGIPFRKTSCTHEIVKPGVSRELNNLKDIPLSAIQDAMKFLLDNKNSFEIIIDNLEEGYFRAECESQDINLMIWCRIMSEDKLIGYIGIDFLTYNKNIDKNLCLSSVTKVAKLIEFEINHPN